MLHIACPEARVPIQSVCGLQFRLPATRLMAGGPVGIDIYGTGVAHMKYSIALALALILNATANLMMKFGVKRFGPGGVSLEQGLVPAATTVLANWVLIVGLLCFAVNVAFYTYALSGIKISVAYPIMVSGGFAVIAVVAWRYLGETLSTAQWAGVGMILVGVFLVASQAERQLGAPEPPRKVVESQAPAPE